MKDRTALAHSRFRRLDRMSVHTLMTAHPASYAALRADTCSSHSEVKHAAEWLSAVAEAPRQPWKNDADCSVSSENQVFSFSKLIGILAMGVEPICALQDSFDLVLVVSNNLDLEEAACGAGTQLKRP